VPSSLAGVAQPHKANKAPDAPRSIRSIHSRAEFDSLAVVYDANTPYALPHVLFVIDRRDKNRIYYVNTNLYKFHKDFVNGTYLSLERGQEFFENNYLKPNRRFIMGTIAYQTPVQRWTYEFWEGDLIRPIKSNPRRTLLTQRSSRRWLQAKFKSSGRGLYKSTVCNSFRKLRFRKTRNISR
jgi:hypothetical protein